MLIDSHCHLDYFTEAERQAVIARAHAAGVERMVTIGTSMHQSETAIAIAESDPSVFACIGVHP
ncbi:MAG: LuxR family transcriptional regulator, partial [Acidiphilium sp. 21-68-69]